MRHAAVAPSSGPSSSPATSPAPPWWALAVLAIVLGFGWLGTRGLGEPDETRYALVADEMLASGEWLVPTLHQAPHFAKPPLTYWAIAAGQLPFGPTPWGSRLFLGVAFGLTTLLIARFGEQLWDDPRGRWAGVIHATTLCPFVAASLVTTDTLLLLWETVALYAFWRSWTVPERAGRIWRTGAWAALGAAFATKGPPGLLPVLLVAAFRWLRPRSAAAPRVFSVPGALLFALIGLPWYGLMIAAYPGLLGHFLGHEIYDRVVGGVELRHGGWLDPLRIYGPVLTAGCLPWLVVALAAPRSLARLVRRVRWRGSPRARLLLIWIAVPVVVFSLSASRMYLYVLPVFPALALGAAGAALRGGGGRFLRPSRAGAVALIAAIALLGLRIAAAHYPNHRDARQLAEPVEPLASRDADLVAVGRPLHGFDLQLGLLGRVAGRPAPPVEGACRPPGPGRAAEDLDRLERPRIYVADGDSLQRLRRELAAAEASGEVRCTNPVGNMRSKAIRCEPRRPPDVRRVAVLLDAARDSTELHALSCRVRRLTDTLRIEAVYRIPASAVRSSWRRRWLPPAPDGLFWWLERRDASLIRLPAGRHRRWDGPGGTVTLDVAPIGDRSGSYRLSLHRPARRPPLATLRLTRERPVALVEWRPESARPTLRHAPGSISSKAGGAPTGGR